MLLEDAPLDLHRILVKDARGVAFSRLVPQ